jgi:hypothetical protein
LSLHFIKTDNASLANKIELRKCATERLLALRVLDLYAGNNTIWNQIHTDRYLGVDSKKGKGKNLLADSKRIAGSIDLSDFNVIDCDSYGIPFDVLVKIMNNKTLQDETVIIYTAITNSLSGLNLECLKMFGVRKIYKKCHHLIARNALDMFYGMLYNNGVRRVTFLETTGSFTKHYGFFAVDTLPLS